MYITIKGKNVTLYTMLTLKKQDGLSVYRPSFKLKFLNTHAIACVSEGSSYWRRYISGILANVLSSMCIEYSADVDAKILQKRMR